MFESSESLLYLVTHPHPTWLEQVTMLIESGIGMVQIRDKEANDSQLAHQVEAVLEHIAQHDLSCTILLNDRVHLARRFGLGVHLGQSDMCPLLARELLGPDVVIGWTIHDDLSLIESKRTAIQYVGVGPIFPTQTKLDTNSVLGVERLKQVCDESPIPVVAIGGIDSTNIGQVRTANPWGIAISSALMRADRDSFEDFVC